MTLVAERTEKAMGTQSTPAAAEASRPILKSPVAVPAMASGALLWLCHFPLAWGWLGWVALVPLLTLVRAETTNRRRYWSAYLGGLVFFVPALQWMRVADWRMYATWLMLAFYCAAYVPLGLFLIRLLDRRTRTPLCLSVPVVWVALEWVRSFLMTGFAWYYLGHGQFQFASLIQVADLGGVYAISFLVAAVNGWLCDVLFHIPAFCDRFHWRETSVANVRQARGATAGLWLQGAGIAMLLVAAVGYGMWRLDQDIFVPGPRIALLQTNVPQSARDGRASRDQMLIQNTALPYFACLDEPLPELIVWPETSFLIDSRRDMNSPPEYLGLYTSIAPKLPLSRMPAFDLDLSQRMDDHFRTNLSVCYPTQHLLGINTHAFDESGKMTRYSSALLVDEGGRPARRFDKIHRVPFGEYVPLRDWLPFMDIFSPYGAGHNFDIAPGEVMTRFPVRNRPYQYGSLVCFEDSDAALARRYAQNGADGKPVDFLVNISNDGWFHATCEHEEHLIVSMFRAIENRRTLVRAANMGISAVIDPNGRILKPRETTPMPPDADHPSNDPRLARAQKIWEGMNMWSTIKKLEKVRPEDKIKTWEVLPAANGKFEELPPSEFAEFKANAGVLFATVPIDGRVSFYSQWGDWLPIGCWGVFGAVLGWSLIARRRTPAGRAA